MLDRRFDDDRLPHGRLHCRRVATGAPPLVPTAPALSALSDSMDGLIDYPFPLRDGKLAVLSLPIRLAKEDADRRDRARGRPCCSPLRGRCSRGRPGCSRERWNLGSDSPSQDSSGRSPTAGQRSSPSVTPCPLTEVRCSVLVWLHRFLNVCEGCTSSVPASRALGLPNTAELLREVEKLSKAQGWGRCFE